MAGKTSFSSTVWVSFGFFSVNFEIWWAELIRTKGLEKINLEDLVEELLPKGRSMVPTKVKEDLLGKIKVFLENDEDYKTLSGF